MASRDPDRPNVLFILSDDQGPWALGAAGNTEIHTPTLDTLAATGLRLSSFFCTSPVCSPARASLFTGQIPSRHGVHDWLAGRQIGSDGIDFLAGQPLLTDVLADAGYRCGLSGKWHLGANDQPRKGFVHWFAHQFGGGPYYGAPVVRDRQLMTEPGYLTDAFADDAAAFIATEATNDEPFWASLHFTAPHSPWTDGNHPADVIAAYDDCPFQTCPQEPEHPWLVRNPDGTPNARDHDLRASLQGYYASITAMDSAISRVLQTLTDLRLRDSTLVVFSSDNGFNCGHHGIWGKGNGTYPQNMYDSSVKVPAIFHQPHRIPAATVVDELFSGYDLAPTLLEFLGLPTDALGVGPGRSFARTLRGAAAAGHHRVVVFDEYGPVRMIRNRDWKYVLRCDGAGDELYDVHNDPDERTNLISDPAQRRRITDLHGQLDDWFTAFSAPANDGAQLPVSGQGQLDLTARGVSAFRPPVVHRR